jgi:hypothetical protein
LAESSISRHVAKKRAINRVVHEDNQVLVPSKAVSERNDDAQADYVKSKESIRSFLLVPIHHSCLQLNTQKYRLPNMTMVNSSVAHLLLLRMLLECWRASCLTSEAWPVVHAASVRRIVRLWTSRLVNFRPQNAPNVLPSHKHELVLKPSKPHMIPDSVYSSDPSEHIKNEFLMFASPLLAHRVSTDDDNNNLFWYR